MVWGWDGGHGEGVRIGKAMMEWGKDENFYRVILYY